MEYVDVEEFKHDQCYHCGATGFINFSFEDFFKDIKLYNHECTIMINGIPVAIIKPVEVV